MKIPDLIKLAVEKQDWKIVCGVYTAITGEPLELPKPKTEAEKILELDISPGLLESLGINIHSQESNEALENDILANVEEEVNSKEEQPVKKKEDFRVEKKKREKGNGERQARRESMSIPDKRINRFKDDLRVDSKDLKKNNPILKKVYDNVKQHSTRSSLIAGENVVDTGTFVEVECGLCGKEERVSMALSHGYDPDPDENTYRCNSCCTGSGRKRIND